MFETLDLFAITFLGVLCASPQSRAQTAYDAVDPFIGTTGDGNTFPGASLPFGMIQWSPDSGSDGWYFYRQSEHPWIQPDAPERGRLSALRRLPYPALDGGTHDESGGRHPTHTPSHFVMTRKRRIPATMRSRSTTEARWN